MNEALLNLSEKSETERSSTMNSKTNFITRGRMIALAVILTFIILAVFAFDSRLLIRKYTVEAEQIMEMAEAEKKEAVTATQP
jgi:hypothetical protein